MRDVVRFAYVRSNGRTAPAVARPPESPPHSAAVCALAHRLNDPFLRFWFRYVYPNRSALEAGASRQVLKTVVLRDLDTFMGGPFEDICRQRLIADGQRRPTLHAFLNADPGKLFSTPERARKFLFSPDLDEGAVRQHAARLGRESFRAVLETSYVRPDPARFRGTPLLVLGAERDYIIPTREVARTADAYGAELQILPDLAHDVMLDTRWRQAADALLAWLVRTLEDRGPSR